MLTILQTILPAVITVLLNILFYWSIKNKIDKSLEEYKIAYSGVFKERIDIYKQLLKYVGQIRLLIEQLNISMDSEINDEIKLQLNSLNTTYRDNRPFLSNDLVTKFADLVSKLQETYEGIFLGNLSSRSPDSSISADNRAEFQKDYSKSISILRSPEGLADLENGIIHEMRVELHTV